MGSYRAVGAGDCNPMWTANWFDPLGRDRPTRAEESAAAVELLEVRRPEGVMILIRTRIYP